MKEKESSGKTLITDKQLEFIKKLQKELENTVPEEKLIQYVKKQYGVDDLHKLTRIQASDLISELLDIKKKEGASGNKGG
jgi:hypothetical protein